MNHLSSHASLPITYARLVQTRLQMEYSSHKSKLYTVKKVRWQCLMNCLVSPLSFSSNCGAASMVYSNLSDRCKLHLNLDHPSRQFCWICNSGKGFQQYSHWASTVCQALAANDPPPIFHLGSQGLHFQSPFTNSNTVWNEKKQKLP